MTPSTRARFLDDPVVTVSGQFALCRALTDPAPTGPGQRPWGLRDLVANETPAAVGLPPVRYDHLRQVSVLDDGTGRLFVDVVAGLPTAPTTSRVDGEDPPSSED